MCTQILIAIEIMVLIKLMFIFKLTKCLERPDSNDKATSNAFTFYYYTQSSHVHVVNKPNISQTAGAIFHKPTL